MIRALIVDDEIHSRDELEALLEETGEFLVAGKCENAIDALKVIKREKPEVVFLDIQMPGITGMELLGMIDEEIMPIVVFVTAYDEYALKAFEVNAIDYIMKPIEENRLRIAVNKVVKTTQDTGSRVQNGLDDEAARIKIDRIPADTNGKTVLVSLSDIVYAYTEQDAVYVKTFSDVLSTHFTLKELEARLDPGVFFRTHRCCLVNLRKVKEIIPFFNGTYTLVMDDTDRSEVPLSRAQAKKLRRILGF